MLIGELSERSGVSPRSLRYYEQHGLIRAARGANRYRKYDESSVEQASTVRLLFGMGFSRDAVRSVLACRGDAPVEAHSDAAAHIERIRDEMDAQIARLRGTRSLLDDFLTDQAQVPRR